MLMSCSLGDGRTRKGMSIREGQSYEISLVPALEKIRLWSLFLRHEAHLLATHNRSFVICSTPSAKHCSKSLLSLPRSRHCREDLLRRRDNRRACAYSNERDRSQFA